MAGFARLDHIVHTFIGKPIAWTLYGLWLAATWAGRTGVNVGGWVQSRWAEHRQKKETNRSSVA